MQEFLDQAAHNQKLLDTLEKDYPDDFFDWKITLLFYIAIHYLKALAANKKVNIGSTHFEIENNVSPFSKKQPTMRITRWAWESYRDLYQYSRTARYDGIFDASAFQQLKKADYQHAHAEFTTFTKYIASQGVPVPGLINPVQKTANNP